MEVKYEQEPKEKVQKRANKIINEEVKGQRENKIKN